MKIKTKLTLLISSFSLIILFMFIATAFVGLQLKDDGLIINLAGRQRMLSQKMVKSMFYNLLIMENDKDSGEKASKEAINAMEVFAITLNALKNSGTAPLSLDLKTTEYRQCPKPPKDIYLQLDKVSNIWKLFSGHMKTVLSQKDDSGKSLAWVKNNNMVLLKEMNKAVVMMQLASEKKLDILKKIQIVSIIVAIIITLVALKIIFGTLSRLKAIEVFSKEFMHGNIRVKSQLTGSDELGMIGSHLDSMAETLALNIKYIIEKADILKASSGTLSSSLSDLSAEMEHVSEKSSDVADDANNMSLNMNSVAAAVEEASTNVGIVSDSANQIMVKIDEIAGDTDNARNISGAAVLRAKESTEKIAKLGLAANEIGDVTETINEISEQTNLLALNATIEAARAGEAGKGFAVVANEIKELARQTAEATNDIKEKVEVIQKSTLETVGDIESVSKVVADVNDIILGIGSAVTEQAETTKEIAENISQASLGIQEVKENVSNSSSASQNVAENISDINNTTKEANTRSSEVLSEAEKLDAISADIFNILKNMKV